MCSIHRQQSSLPANVGRQRRAGRPASARGPGQPPGLPTRSRTAGVQWQTFYHARAMDATSVKTARCRSFSRIAAASRPRPPAHSSCPWTQSLPLLAGGGWRGAIRPRPGPTFMPARTFQNRGRLARPLHAMCATCSLETVVAKTAGDERQMSLVDICNCVFM